MFLMSKKLLTLSLAFLLSNLLAGLALAKTPQEGLTPEQARAKVARAGTGEKAKVTVWTKDGKKTKGYVSQAGEDNFVLRDRKTDTPTTIAYSDVTKLDINRGHSGLRNTLIGVGVGVAAVFATLAIIFVSIGGD
jgi:hypothetical protein